ncbi:MAG: hypothetical protein JW891_07315 [Candidatus Lokiarchaeota archaeon]|nr:hypothetical protein [Candidatus Lokiarchaeota archaeon]
MGTWGPGIFENDYALDYLLDLGNLLVEKIDELTSTKDLGWEFTSVNFLIESYIKYDQASFLFEYVFTENEKMILGDLEEEEVESEFMPNVKIMSLLCAIAKLDPPQKSLVISWKKRVLDIYDSEIDDWNPSENYKIERRKVLEETFLELEKQST